VRRPESSSCSPPSTRRRHSSDRRRGLRGQQDTPCTRRMNSARRFHRSVQADNLRSRPRRSAVPAQRRSGQSGTLRHRTALLSVRIGCSTVRSDSPHNRAPYPDRPTRRICQDNSPSNHCRPGCRSDRENCDGSTQASGHESARDIARSVVCTDLPCDERENDCHCVRMSDHSAHAPSSVVSPYPAPERGGHPTGQGVHTDCPSEE
jgi:hypothetical protein